MASTEIPGAGSSATDHGLDGVHPRQTDFLQPFRQTAVTGHIVEPASSEAANLCESDRLMVAGQHHGVCVGRQPLEQGGPVHAARAAVRSPRPPSDRPIVLTRPAGVPSATAGAIAWC